MRISDISINSFRGILKFDAVLSQKSLVVTGPNGTGKSGVIDAVDFLFTGDLQRLRGEGTGLISLDEHGKHIDSKIEDVIVAATIEANSKIFKVTRKLSDKKLNLISGDKDQFEQLENQMRAGQFLLSRRELLKFIACTGQQRSEGIQSLLDTSGIEKIRKDLQSTFASQGKTVSDLEFAIQTNLSAADTFLGLPAKSDSSARRVKINELRKVLGKPEIVTWKDDTNIVSDIDPHAAVDSKVQKKSLFTTQLEFIDLPKITSPLDSQGRSIKSALAKAITKISKINNYSRLLAGNDLISKGIDLIGNDICPLCDTNFKDNDLKLHLEKKKNLSDQAMSAKNEFDGFVTSYVPLLNRLKSNLNNLLPTLEASKSNLITEISKYTKDIDKRISDLSMLADTISLAPILLQEKYLIDLGSYEDFLKNLSQFRDELPEESPEEKAKKTLHEVATLFKTVITTNSKLKIDKKKFDVIKKISDDFLKTRETFFFKLIQTSRK